MGKCLIAKYLRTTIKNLNITAHGALPMYFDLLGPHFVIAIRGSLADNWYEALEYHWLALFNIIAYCLKFGWHLQRADVQNKARSRSST